MRPIVYLFATCLIILTACQSKQPSVKLPDASQGLVVAETVSKENSASQESPEHMEKGYLLMKNSDCFTCHANDVKLVGPSFMEIAKKYVAQDKSLATLTNKIINGGSGNWGQLPMQPHSQLKITDAEEMVNYILALK